MVAPPVKKTTTATTQNPADAGNTAFDLGVFNTLYDKQQTLMQTRQQEEQKALESQTKMNKDLSAIQEQSLQTRQTYVEQSVLPAVKETARLEAARQEQQKLMGSNSLMDYLTIMDKQFTNPSMYTSEGRARQRAELNANLAMGATLNAAQQDVLNAQMDSVKNKNLIENSKFIQADLLEKQNAQTLESHVNRYKVMTEGLTAERNAKTLVLDNMTMDQLKEASKASVQNSGKVNIQGFEMTQSQVDSKIASIVDVQYDMTVKQSAMAAKNQALVDEANSRMLSKLSKSQVEALATGRTIEISDGKGSMIPVDPAEFKREDIQNAYDFKQKVFQNEVDKQIKSTQAFDIADTMIIPQRQAALAVANNASIPETNPVKMRMRSKTQQMESITARYLGIKEQVTKNSTAENVQALAEIESTMATQLEKSQTADTALIEKQAKIDGQGNEHLANMYRATYRGETVDPVDVSNFVTTNLKKGLDVGKALGPTLSKVAAKNYQDQLMKLRGSQNPMNPKNDSEIQEEAAQIAFEQTMTTAAQKASDDFLIGQARIQPNRTMDQQTPIANVRDSRGRKYFDENSWGAFLNKADSEAVQRVKEPGQFDWVDDGMIEQLKKGETVTSGDNSLTPNQWRDVISQYENVSLLLNLDTLRPGLAKEYVSWWNENGPAYANDYANQQMESAPMASVQENAIRATTSGIINGSIVRYGQTIAESEDKFTGQQQKLRRDWVSYDMEPANRQAALLQFDSNLTDSERAMVLRDGLGPIIKEGKQKGLEYDEVNAMVEEAIANPEQRMPQIAENPALKKALAKVAISRGATLIGMEALTDSPWLYGNDKVVSDSIWSRLSSENKFERAATKMPGADMLSTSFEYPGQRGVRPGLSDVFGGHNGWLGNETNTKPYDWYRKIMSDLK